MTRAVIAVQKGARGVRADVTAAEESLPFPATVEPVEVDPHSWMHLDDVGWERAELLSVADELRSVEALRPFVAAVEDRFPRLDLPGGLPWYASHLDEQGCAAWPWIFTCNVCGTENRVAAGLPGREQPSCRGCQSNVRYRATVRALVESVLGDNLPLSSFSPRPNVRGLGISDWGGYADALSEVFSYTKTQLDAEPRFDLTEAPDKHMLGAFDFVIAGDVLEHVAPPVESSMSHLRAVLRRGGVAVLTVPFTRWPKHVEHFPNLHRWSLDESGSEPVLVNERADGTVERFTSLCFHGPGHSLEMRVFTEESFVTALESAGFVDVSFSNHPCLRYGILMPDWPGPVVATAP